MSGFLRVARSVKWLDGSGALRRLQRVRSLRIAHSLVNRLNRSLSTASSASKATSSPSASPSTPQPQEPGGGKVGSMMKNYMKPREIVSELDRFIVGQHDAKRAVAIALRNRWRRQQLDDSLRDEVIPKNILMVGPTGVGKTEIARRLAKLANAPFVKAEATKFTEVGFHGADVDQIIKDLMEESVRLVRARRLSALGEKLEELVNQRLLELLAETYHDRDVTQLRKDLRAGLLESTEVEAEVRAPLGGPGAEQFLSLQEFLERVAGGKPKKRKMSIKEYRPILRETLSAVHVEQADVVKEALQLCENEGIVFLDEIDKIANPDGKQMHYGPDASAEGVQRDLLPLIEGTTIQTKYGNVKTDHILWIASGAFHHVKPSDLLSELQGRLPIRVYLKDLTEEDLYRILTEPETNLIKQQTALLETEKVDLTFTDQAIRRMAKLAREVNTTVDNIGARRLYTVIENVVDEISFDAPDKPGSAVVVDAELVNKKVGPLMVKGDMKRFIL